MKTKVVTGIMLTMLLTLACSNLARAEPAVELAYDDGTWENDLCVSTSTGGKLLVRFSLPSGWSSAKLLTAKFAMADAGLEFRVHIYDSDGTPPTTELTTPFDVTPSTTGWFEVDLSGLNIVVSGDFYIAKEQIIPSCVPPYIYVDSSQPIDGRSYSWLPWEPYWYQWWDADFGIRAVVGEVVVPADVDIDPDTLNLKSNGEWVTAYIELPSDYDVNNIAVESVLLDGVIPVATDAPVAVGDYDVDGIPDLMVKFNRDAVIDFLGTMDFADETGKFREVTLTISGAVGEETFEGSDTVKVIL